MVTIKVPQLSWHNPRDLEITFPDGWQVDVHDMAGCDTPPLTAEQIKAAVSRPIGMPPIREMARGRKNVVIIFDDLTRSTRVAKIVPAVLEELAAAGIPDRNIRFVGAVGTHGPLTRPDLTKKLGEAVMARYAVYNHNAFGDLKHVGTTSRGNKVMVNAEVMNCDLKIAIGSVSPHALAVYSGGGKMILPGVCGRDTIAFNHAMQPKPDEVRNYDTNPRRLDMEEAAKMAGLDVAIECLVNTWGETCAMFAGAEEPAHEACVKAAMKHYGADKASDSDIVVANVYVKAMEWATGSKTAACVRKGGDLVVLANAPDGQINHYLMAGWGSTLKGEEMESPNMAHLNRIFVYTEYPVVGTFTNHHKVQQANNWNAISKALADAHGARARVAVYPSADLIFFK